MGIKFSQFIRAFDITDDAALAGLQDGSNKRFTFGLIKQWIKDFLTPADIGAQEEITASGILKGDGAGGVSTATPGTDYATPDQIPTTPADIGALPADKTAVGSYRMMYVHRITGAAGWYHFLDISTAEGQTRVIQLLIDNGQSSVSGILRIYMFRTSSGSLTSSSIVNWMATTIPIDYVRWTYSNGVTSFYVYKSSGTDRAITFTVLSAINRAGTNLAPSILEWDNVAVSEPTTATPATANILNNAATADSATNALNDGNGDVIEAASYVKKKNGVYYAICNTPAATTIKSISIPEITGLVDGLCINIEFPNGITDSGTIVGIQLDVNGYGAVSLGIERGYNSFTPWTSYDAIGVVTAVYSQIGTQQGVPVYAWKVTNISHASNGFIGLTLLSNDVNSPHGYDVDGIPTAATPKAVKTAYDLAASKSKLVRFTAQAVSAASNAEIFRITDSDITTDTEVVSVEFADPSYITAGGSWTSYAGYVAFTGTCTAATTADVILKI
ncbi:MAG: tail fiber protein [Oscillospiraceae bacterium]|nr:tail fiber protein [Oscillospiraceae bacterium]